MTVPEPPEPPRPPEPPDISPGSRYVAMGSSFAAGPGIGRRAPGSPRAAGRSSANYAHQVARRLALDLDDVTFSGATTQDMLAATSAGRPAQIDAVTPATKLVTLTNKTDEVLNALAAAGGYLGVCAAALNWRRGGSCRTRPSFSSRSSQSGGIPSGTAPPLAP